MRQEDSKKAFESLLKIKGYTYRYSYNENGELLMVSNDGHVNLEDVNYLPSHVCFQNNGYVDLSSIKTLPEYTVFENSGNIYLDSLKIFSKGVRFKNGKYIFGTKFGTSHWWKFLFIEEISTQKIINCFIKQIYG